MNNNTLSGVKQVVLDLTPAHHWLLCTFVEKMTSKGQSSSSVFDAMVFKETLAYMFGAVVDDLVTYTKNQKNNIVDSTQKHNLVRNEIADSMIDYFPNQQEAMAVIGQLENILLHIFISSIPQQFDFRISNYYLVSETTLLIELAD